MSYDTNTNNTNTRAAVAWMWVFVIGFLGFFIWVASLANREVTTTVTGTESIPYSTTYVDDPELEYGEKKTRTPGTTGTRTVTYEVTKQGGKEKRKKQTKSDVTREPVDAVVARGTKVVWHCQDATSYDKNPYNDNYCKDSHGNYRYVSDSEARALDHSYSPGQSGHWWYNSK